MSIYVRKVDNYYGIWDSINCVFLEAEYLGIKEEDIKEYMKENPFPKEEGYAHNKYTIKDMLGDMKSGGSLIIAGTEKQADWVAEMISKLL